MRQVSVLLLVGNNSRDTGSEFTGDCNIDAIGEGMFNGDTKRLWF